jgi:hypothetical protein
VVFEAGILRKRLQKVVTGGPIALTAERAPTTLLQSTARGALAGDPTAGCDVKMAARVNKAYFMFNTIIADV